jgi:hypothetical protein
MPSRIIKFLEKLSPAEREIHIRTASQYITHPEVLHIVQNLSSESDAEADAEADAKLQKFLSVLGLQLQVTSWMGSRR